MGPGSPTHEAIRALLERRDLRARLMRHAYARTRSVTDAKDFVQEAIKKVLEGKYPWRPEKCPELVDHLGSVINSLVWNRTTSAARARERPLPPEHAERMVDGAPNPEQALIEREEARALSLRVQRWMLALRERLHGDDIALRVLDLFEQGVESAGDQAEAAQRSREDIDKARRRIGYHAGATMRVEGEDGGGAVAQELTP
jgi:hypothetical protein